MQNVTEDGNAVEIIEGNKLIAEFMGASFIDKLAATVFFPEGDAAIIGRRYLHEMDLKYHSSWSWLMPVVEKIESLDFVSIIHGYGASVTPDLETFCIFKEGNYRRGYGESKSKIAAVWLAVVDFIKWYNQSESCHR